MEDKSVDKGVTEGSVTHDQLRAHHEQLVVTARDLAFAAALDSDGLIGRFRQAVDAANEVISFERCLLKHGVAFTPVRKRITVETTR